MSEQSRRAAAVSLARMLHPDTGRPAAAAVSAAGCGVYLGGLDAPSRGWRSSRVGTLSRRLRDLATGITVWRERWAAIDELTSVSDRQLADIGLGRAQIYQAFDPTALARARDATPRRVARGLEQLVLADLGLRRTLPRPMIGG